MERPVPIGRRAAEQRAVDPHGREQRAASGGRLLRRDGGQAPKLVRVLKGARKRRAAVHLRAVADGQAHDAAVRQRADPADLDVAIGGGLLPRRVRPDMGQPAVAVFDLPRVAIGQVLALLEGERAAGRRRRLLLRRGRLFPRELGKDVQIDLLRFLVRIRQFRGIPVDLLLDDLLRARAAELIERRVADQPASMRSASSCVNTAFSST